VLVVGAASEASLEHRRLADGRAAVARLAESGARAREAAKVVAELTGLRVNDLYQP
jgi:hypothetical protein